MSLFRLIGSSLVYHWRVQVAVALGVAIATAVLTGALVVGDSIRGSLRHLTIDRLGKIDEVVIANRFFRTPLASEIEAFPHFSEYYTQAVPVIILPGSVTNRQTKSLAGDVTVIGSDERFWSLGEGRPAVLPGPDEIVVNERLAAAENLNVEVGDTVILQLGRPSSIPADSPLGRKTDTIRRKTLTVCAIIPTEGLGRFGLRPNQQLPANVYVATGTIQEMLDQGDRVNAILITGRAADEAADERASKHFAAHVRPTLADYGLQLGEVVIRDGDKIVSRYYNLTSDRMLLEPAVVDAATRAWSGETVQPAFTYLANWIIDGERRIPYSTITAIDSIAGLGPLLDEDGQPIVLGENEIALNSWTARPDHLAARRGDTISITYFEPDTTHGEVREGDAEYRLKEVVALGRDGQPLTTANDRSLTPEVPGVTDQASIDDWNPPFPFDASRIRDDRDEAYWEQYGPTPKAFVSLSAGRRLWASRFGETTSLRVVPREGLTREDLIERLEAAMNPAELGFMVRPVKREGLEASAGTTPFDVLFLLFSMFLIASALMLVSLFFRLGVEQRSQEIGLLAAVGFPRGRIAAVLAGEALIVAAAGALVGAVGGLAYGWLMLVGLRTWWVDAVSTPFLHLYPRVTSLVVGFAGGLFVCAITILWTLRRVGRLPVQGLLAGQFESGIEGSDRRGRLAQWAPLGAFVLACCLIPVAWQLGGEAQAGAFFAAGALVLFAALSWIRGWLHSAGTQSKSVTRMGSVWLAMRNAARNPGRSTLTIGLVAAASFLIIAVSAFRLEESEQGSGGFNLMALSAAPLFYDLNRAEGQFELGIDSQTGQLLEESRTVSLRVQAGEDASCLNLYRPRQPRVLGVPEDMTGNFPWADPGQPVDDPWQLLRDPLPAADDESRLVPAILDQNTAMYSLHLWQGVGETFEIEDERGRRVKLQVVALLKNSIFQGEILIGERNFLELFPSASGYRYFLIRSPRGRASELQAALEDRLADFGFDVIATRRRLAEFFAVQNTYLSTFQSLGGLGLLLGTFGLATVQLRNVLARRGELALMRAAGFRRRRLAMIVMLETLMLLLAGLGTGLAAALVAVLPHWLLGGAKMPWTGLAATMALVLAAGLIGGLAAVRATLKAPLIAALRGD